jgi:hypothetical protein
MAGEEFSVTPAEAEGEFSSLRSFYGPHASTPAPQSISVDCRWWRGRGSLKTAAPECGLPS